VNWGAVWGISLVVLAVVLYDWPRMNEDEKKEKTAFAVMTTMVWLLAILLTFYPDMPGPTELVEAVYKPLAKILE